MPKSISINDLPKHLRDQVLQQDGKKSAKPAEPKPRMNKTETAYAEFLEFEKSQGRVLWFGFEKIRLVIADGKRKAWFKPDFFVVLPDGTIEARETKGWWREAARLRIKVAADLYPWIRFLGVKRDGSGWQYEEF